MLIWRIQKKFPIPKNELMKKLEWLGSSDEQNRVYYSQDYGNDDGDKWNFSIDEGEDLADYLMSQLIGSKYSKTQMEVLNYMALCLDSKGYFTESLDEVAARFHMDAEDVGALLFILQGLEPAGVGARSLKECLLLQLDRQGIEDIPCVPS